MKVFMSVLALCLTTFSAWAVGDITLKLGEQTEVKGDGRAMVRVAVGDPTVASVTPLSKSALLVKGDQVGNTTLLVWHERNGEPTRYPISVNPTGVSTVGVQVQTDIKVVEISRSALQEAGVSFGKFSGNTTVGVGSAVGGGNLFANSNVLPLADAFNVTIGDMSRGILGAISALNANGFAYTLAEPSLVTMSGHNATFLAGGEFPYPKSSRDGDISIDFKEFGVRLNIAPTVLDDNRIQLKVAPEVSELNYSQGVQLENVTVPGLSVRRTDTTIQLGDGESFVISGLISQNTMQNSDRFPGLGDLPIIGAFFSSKRFEKNDKELMMVVTPHIVSPMAKNAPLPSLPGEIYKNYDPNFLELIFLNSSPKELPQNIGFSTGM